MFFCFKVKGDFLLLHEPEISGLDKVINMFDRTNEIVIF
jgi:hypothetical protein